MMWYEIMFLFRLAVYQASLAGLQLYKAAMSWKKNPTLPYLPSQSWNTGKELMYMHTIALTRS